MRSLLFVPADGGKKLDKAFASGADAVIVDLEDSIAPERKAAARDIAASFLRDAIKSVTRPRLLVRVNGLATGLTDACQVLHDWDGHSDATSSAGAAIFQEFVSIASSRGVNLWKVPFSAKQPLTTPRTLSTEPDVVDAMAAAITRVTGRGFDLSETYGEMHRSGDRGSAGWPLGGGM